MIAVLLPAYNEEVSLPFLLPKIDRTMKKAGLDYVLVIGNDGSSDNTADLLEEYATQYPLEVVTHAMNRGLGETARDLFERAAEICSPSDVMIRMDCDDTHEPDNILKMLEKIEEGYDVVIASRFQPGGGQKGVSRYRATLSRGANLFMKIMFPLKGVKEYSCGFRAYRADVIQTAIQFYGNNFIQLKGLGFTGTLEKLIKLKILGARFSEIPFVLRYDQKQSSSKMVSSITTLGYVTMALLYHWPWGGWRRRYKRMEKPVLHAVPTTNEMPTSEKQAA